MYWGASRRRALSLERTSAREGRRDGNLGQKPRGLRPITVADNLNPCSNPFDKPAECVCLVPKLERDHATLGCEVQGNGVEPCSKLHNGSSSPFALFLDLIQSPLKSSNSASVGFNGVAGSIGWMSLQLVAVAAWQG
ncbi:hypothetical protein CC86DRAFT_171817 [Ophiobolus disseminans]|uniref:Uncharacterized protein n=1 Tax=Ophiobolus disseminans TaxID=1469910 RepID=A0A6A6ZCZ4_9PLEO|nr:hypothetical protein CC86DRAFT_171817 [Ophiobolus disseminans]